MTALTIIITILVAIFTAFQGVSAVVAVRDSTQRRRSDELIRALEFHKEATEVDALRERLAKEGRPLDLAAEEHLKALHQRLDYVQQVLRDEGIIEDKRDKKEKSKKGENDTASQIGELIDVTLQKIHDSLPPDQVQEAVDEMYTDNSVKPTTVVDAAKTAGKLTVDPSSPVFKTHADVAYLFGKRYKQYMRGSITLANGFDVWFPGFDPDDPVFDNRLLDNGETITDLAAADAPALTAAEKARQVIVFGKDKGMAGYQFKGVFQSQSREGGVTTRKRVSDVIYFDTDGRYDVKALS